MTGGDTRECYACKERGRGFPSGFADCRACNGSGRVPVAPPPEPMTAIDFETRIGSLLSEVLSAPLMACAGPRTGLCLEVHFWRKREARKVYRDLQKRGFTVGFCAAPYGRRSRGATVRIWQ